MTIAELTGAQFKGPVMLPTRKKIYCVLRSPHVDKDAREHFEVRTHHRCVCARVGGGARTAGFWGGCCWQRQAAQARMGLSSMQKQQQARAAAAQLEEGRAGGWQPQGVGMCVAAWQRGVARAGVPAASTAASVVGTGMLQGQFRTGGLKPQPHLCHPPLTSAHAHMLPACTPRTPTRRLVDFKKLSAQTVEALMQWVPPPGVEMEVGAARICTHTHFPLAAGKRAGHPVMRAHSSAMLAVAVGHAELSSAGALLRTAQPQANRSCTQPSHHAMVERTLACSISTGRCCMSDGTTNKKSACRALPQPAQTAATEHCSARLVRSMYAPPACSVVQQALLASAWQRPRTVPCPLVEHTRASLLSSGAQRPPIGPPSLQLVRLPPRTRRAPSAPTTLVATRRGGCRSGSRPRRWHERCDTCLFRGGRGWWVGDGGVITQF